MNAEFLVRLIAQHPESPAGFHTDYGSPGIPPLHSVSSPKFFPPTKYILEKNNNNNNCDHSHTLRFVCLKQSISK